MNSCHRHHNCLKPRKQNKEDLIIHNEYQMTEGFILPSRGKEFCSLVFPPCRPLRNAKGSAITGITFTVVHYGE